jgi:hypothetical protein|tara:strand:+ start:97 stop:489 length:393 start_codon:yes stop_codon:yes gene_type:complete
MPNYAKLMREPYETELEYFKSNPNVSGMATEDDRIILNPNSKLSKSEKDAVALNEYGRIVMRTNPQFAPNFKLTDEQAKFLSTNTYKDAPEEDKLATIAARLLSGDPSAGTPTIDQLKFVNKLKEYMDKD